MALRQWHVLVLLQSPLKYVVRGTSGELLFKTVPDIHIENFKGRTWIIDTKWKLLKKSSEDRKYGVSQADVYQMLAYSVTHKCDRLILLYPHQSGAQRICGIQSIFTFVERPDTKLYIATIDLSELATTNDQLLGILMEAASEDAQKVLELNSVP